MFSDLELDIVFVYPLKLVLKIHILSAGESFSQFGSVRSSRCHNVRLSGTSLYLNLSLYRLSQCSSSLEPPLYNIIVGQTRPKILRLVFLRYERMKES